MKKSIPFLRSSAIALLCTLALVSCTDPLTPIPPTWDVNLHLPLSNAERTLEELLGGDSSIYVREGDKNLVVVGKTFALDTVGVGSTLKLENESYSVSRMLDQLAFDVPDILNKDVPVSTLFPGLNDGTYPVPPLMNSTAVSIQIDARQYFQEITFESGKVYFQLHNSLTIPLTFPKPAELYDNNGSLIGSVLITDTLAPSTTMTLPPIILDGMVLSNAMNLSVYIATPGSDGFPVTIFHDMALNIRASIAETRISSAVGCFPAQTFEYSERLDVSQDNGTRIQSGHIASGSVAIALQNYVAVSSTVDIVMNGLVKDGQPLRTSIPVGARSSQNVTIDIAGYSFTPINMTYLPFSVIVHTADSKPDFVRITSSDSISATTSLVDVVFDEVTGTIEPKIVDVQRSQAVNLRISDKFEGSIEYNDVEMWVTIANNSGLPLDIESGKLTCFNDQTSQSASVEIPATRIAPFGTTDVHFENGQVAELFKSFGSSSPNRIDIEAQAVLNKDNAIGTVTANDYISGVVHLEIPMKIGIDSARYTDMTELHLDPDVIDRLKDVQSGELHIEVENHLPAGFTFEIQFLDPTLANLLTPKQSSNEPFHVESGALDKNGSVTASTKTSFLVPLSHDDIQLIIKSKYLAYTVILDKSPVSPILFRMEDFINIKTYATFTTSSTAITSN